MESPFVMVIFGATGDLARNKLVPALFSLFQDGLLPKDFFIVGFSRRELTDEGFHQSFTKLAHEEKWADFAKHLSYQKGDFSNESGYVELIPKLKQMDDQIGGCITRLFYLATPPDNYSVILDFLNSTKLSEGCGQGSSKWTRVIIEKPFGKDIDTAKALDHKLTTIFEERQIFRVDHYLAKETVQNMIAFRFANGIFEPVWNRNYIDSVQITWAEDRGIENHGAFYDGVGMLRDVAQNHLLQLTAAVAMEQPKSFNREDIRDARASVIEKLRPGGDASSVVRGQYEGYRGEKHVKPDSNTETFVAMKFGVDTERFKGVPFYLRAGKHMPANVVEISIVFIQTCHILFKEIGCPEEGNVLTIRIQPDEGIKLHVIAKKPGSKLTLGTVDMKFTYRESFKEKARDAYEKLLLNIFVGDQMLFNRSDELESSWKFISPILEKWQKDGSQPVVYSPGTWGPPKANELIEKDNRHWL